MATPYSPEEIARLEALDHRHLWHPFTQMRDWLREPPLIVASGEGPYLYDIQGRRYLDGVSSLWVTVHGHQHPALNRAITEQLGKVAHSTLLGLSNVPAVELAARLVELAPPGLSRVFYSDSGSTAVEIGLKIAFQYWKHRGQPQRTKFLALGEAYHGDTVGSVSVGGIERFHEIFRPLLFHAKRAPVPYCYRCPLGLSYSECSISCLQELKRILSENKEQIAAVVLEPLVQGAAGMVMHPPGYLLGVRQACDDAGVLLLVDEVATGFGRTGTMFACEQEGVSPDILCVAKGITGGYLPLAATLTTEEIFRAFFGAYEEYKTFFHGHTYTGNPLACAAALASLDLFREEKTLEKLAVEIPRLQEALAPLAALPQVGEIRQRGFMVGIELVADRATKRSFPAARRVGQRVCQKARELGAILRPLGDVIVLMPPLCLGGDELLRLVEITRQAIEAIALPER
jgi:adenosylmethionine-8-amino-7-oxononanoate aminotransferase